MAHVILRVGSAVKNGERAELIVDGVDITSHVIDDGMFAITTNGGEWGVRLTLAVESLEAEIPESVLTSVVQE